MKLVAAFFGVFLSANFAAAEETICDPENPSCVTEPTPAQTPDAETICDPENPACANSTESVAALESPDPAPAQNFQTARFLGAWGTRLSVDSAFEGDEEDIVEAMSYLDLGIEFDPRDDFRVVVEGELRHWAGGKRNPDKTNLLLNAQHVRASYDARLGEAYALWRNDNLSIGLGNIITRWGSTDLTRPGDVINPTDQTTISPLEAAERIPQLTLDLSYTGRGWAVQGLLVPFFVPNRSWAFGRDTSLFNPRNPVVADQFPIGGLFDDLFDPSVQDDVQPALAATEVPDEVPKNVSLGGRFTATVANADVGIGFWHGWDRTQAVTIDDDLRQLLQTAVADGQVLEDLDFLQFFLRNPELLDVSESLTDKAQAGEEIYSSKHRRMQMLLVDLARYVGPIGVRADVAMFPQQTYMTEDFRPVQRPTFAPSLGLSWERIESEDDVTTVTLEGFWRKPFAADSAVTEAFVAEADRGSPDDPLLLIGDGIYGVAGGVLLTVPWIDAQLQVGGAYNISHGDLIASVQLRRSFLGWLTASAGYALFEGPPPGDRLTLGGLYDNNDHVSFAISGVF